MRRYMRADIRRVMTRMPRILVIAAVLLMEFGMVIVSEDANNVLTMKMLFNNQAYGMPLTFVTIMGVIEIVFIYGDDFKAKTMQIAIGTGLPRQKVVHAKWLEYMVITAIDIMAFAIVDLAAIFLKCAVFGGTLTVGVSLGFYPLVLFSSWLSSVCFLGSVMFILIWMQGISVPLLIYLFLASTSVPSILKTLFQLVHLEKYHLQTYTLPGVINSFVVRLKLGFVSVPSLIGILVYMMLSFALASILFKKKELEF